MRYDEQVAEEALAISNRMDAMLKGHPSYYTYPPASAGTVRDLANVVRDLAKLVALHD